MTMKMFSGSPIIIAYLATVKGSVCQQIQERKASTRSNAFEMSSAHTVTVEPDLR